MNIQNLRNRQLHKFTGPPENWITAIKFMTWGLEDKYRNQWANILPGDIFLMHSTSTNTRIKGAKSSVIGFGVVGSNPTIKTGPLWVQERESGNNIWPLLVPFSEIYLLSPYFENHVVPEPTVSNTDEVTKVSLSILENAVPLSSLSGFPQMGSFSSVKSEVVQQIFDRIGQLYVIGSTAIGKEYTPTPLIKLDNVRDEVRYATSLQTLDEVKKKTFSAKGSSFAKDPVLLERAEEAHQSTLEKLMKLFKQAGYDTYFNKHVDLFAVNSKNSFLFEVKSNENTNFLHQARKGIVQLFEYEYFEIEKFHSEKQIKTKTFKNLTFSKEPSNLDYASFMNSIDLGISYFEEDILVPFGKSLGLNLIN